MSNQTRLIKTDLTKLSIFKLYETYGALERSIPLLVSESQELAKAELEQCLALRSEKIDRLYYAWAHHEDAVERAKKEQELLVTARKHHEAQVTKIKGLINWLRHAAPLDSNRIVGRDYEFVLSKKRDLTVEITVPVEEWDKADVNEFCLQQTVTTTKETVVTSMSGDVIERTATPVTKTEIIPNVDKLRSAYQQGQHIPQGVKIQQEYSIKRNRVISSRGVDDLSSKHSKEFLPELETAD